MPRDIDERIIQLFAVNEGHEWTREDDSYLESHAGSRSIGVIALGLGRSRDAVEARLKGRNNG